MAIYIYLCVYPIALVFSQVFLFPPFWHYLKSSLAGVETYHGSFNQQSHSFKIVIDSNMNLLYPYDQNQPQ